MRLVVFYTALLCCFKLSALAAPVDSLVCFQDLDFKNETEKSNFFSVSRNDNSADVIDLLLAPYEKSEGYNSKNAHQQINDCVAYIEKETAEQSNTKRVKFIYNYVHKRFFKVYKLHNSFSNIFESGEYNCVSASAFYAIVFKKLGIPFQIIEAPQHVYLIAYPQSERILIETTAPSNGYLQLTDSYIEKYVKHLADSKLITKEESEKTSANELFKKYYYATSGLELEKMPGVQYFNYSVYYSEDKNYEKACSEIKKAYYLEPSERNTYLLQSVLAYQVSNNDYSDVKQVNNLLILCRFNNLKNKDVSNEAIHQEFDRVLNDQLIKNSDYEKFDASFEKIYTALHDTVLKNEIAFDYHYELSRLGLINLKDKSYELKHLNAAYQLNPKHINLQNIILSYFSKQVDKTNDPAAILKTMTYFSSSFNFLNENNQYNVIKANCFLEMAYQSFSLNDIKQGEDYLKDFEILCTNNKLEPNERYVEKAYAQAASYYYKKGNSVKTRQLLNTGIKYAPENFGLRMRLSQAK